MGSPAEAASRGSAQTRARVPLERRVGFHLRECAASLRAPGSEVKLTTSCEFEPVQGSLCGCRRRTLWKWRVWQRATSLDADQAVHRQSRGPSIAPISPGPIRKPQTPAPSAPVVAPDSPRPSPVWPKPSATPPVAGSALRRGHHAHLRKEEPARERRDGALTKAPPGGCLRRRLRIRLSRGGPRRSTPPTPSQASRTSGWGLFSTCRELHLRFLRLARLGSFRIASRCGTRREVNAERRPPP